MTDRVIIYTDGGADPNPGIGGWAAVLRSGQSEKVLTGNSPETTNNRMELQAAISALQALKRPCTVEFHIDSQYVRKGITQYIDGWAERGWKTSAGKPVQNADLWQMLQAEVARHTIDWHWVQGHSGDPLNERVDELARQARLEITPRQVSDENATRLFLRSSCRGNPGPGGWGVVLEAPGRDEQTSGSASSTTNNRMEVTAALEGLLLVEPGSYVEVFTTSDYLYQGITSWIHGWRKRNWQKKDGTPVANADLWQALDALTRNYQVRWINAKNMTNDALDVAGKLAGEASQLV